MDSRAGAGAATTAANVAGAGASAATGENFGVTTVDDAAAPSFRPPRALPPRPRPAPAAGFRGVGVGGGRRRVWLGLNPGLS